MDVLSRNLLHIIIPDYALGFVIERSSGWRTKIIAFSCLLATIGSKDLLLLSYKLLTFEGGPVKRFIICLLACVAVSLGFSGTASKAQTQWMVVEETTNRTPLPASSVPEAFTGFRSPVDFESNRNGFSWLDYASHHTYSCVRDHWVYHPGWDMNYGSGSDDEGLPVYAVADGVVVYIAKGKLGWENGQWVRRALGWGGIVLQHNYKGQTYYSQYGHTDFHDPGLYEGQRVTKGHLLARIGQVGATGAPHLHFEMRAPNHPNPLKGSYFCDTLPWNGYLYALQQYEYASSWYKDPNPNGAFMQSLQPYSSGGSSVISNATVLSDCRWFASQQWWLNEPATGAVNLWFSDSWYTYRRVSWNSYFGSAEVQHATRKTDQNERWVSACIPSWGYCTGWNKVQR